MFGFDRCSWHHCTGDGYCDGDFVKNEESPTSVNQPTVMDRTAQACHTTRPRALRTINCGRFAEQLPPRNLQTPSNPKSSTHKPPNPKPQTPNPQTLNTQTLNRSSQRSKAHRRKAWSLVTLCRGPLWPQKLITPESSYIH